MQRHPPPSGGRPPNRKDPAMRKGIMALAAISLVAASGLAACGSDNGTGTTTKPKIGVILPDSASSTRWETADRKYLKEAFDKAGVESIIQNAQGDKAQFQTIAEQMLTQKVTVLLIVNLDSGSGKAVLEKAKQAGVGTIDYDRLTLGGGADYYVSFDNEAVGKLQGEGLSKCLTDKGVTKPTVAYLNGSPTDNNATLFRNGYDSILKPKFDSSTYVKGPERSVPDWDGGQAATLFEQMMTEAQGKIDGVLAANDTLGNAAISVLKRTGLNGKVPVTGQDASVGGLQNILSGDQCMTVYKAIKKEADGAAELALALANGQTPSGLVNVKDTQTGKDVKSKLMQPVAIYKDNVKDVIADGFVTKADVCKDSFAALCTSAGIV
jgi:D-xylose transport system substrate-binding protein